MKKGKRKSEDGRLEDGKSPGGKSPGGKSPGGKSPGGKSRAGKSRARKSQGGKALKQKANDGGGPDGKRKRGNPEGKRLAGKNPDGENTRVKSPTEKRQRGSDRTQIAALPFRLDGQGRMEVLLVTSRETRRWIVPKGWPMKGVPDPQAAAREAHEEAGVIGQVGTEPAGSYLYWKRLASSFALCSVKVFPLRVDEVEAEFREMGQRETRWFDVDEAAESVDEPGLSTLIRRFKPAP